MRDLEQMSSDQLRNRLTQCEEEIKGAKSDKTLTLTERVELLQDIRYHISLVKEELRYRSGE